VPVQAAGGTVLTEGEQQGLADFIGVAMCR
jgi:hypothetical protein